MNNLEITFKLNDLEKIMIDTQLPLEEIDCSYREFIYFVHQESRYILANDSIFSLRDHLSDLVKLLSKALSNKLKLHKSLIDNSDKKDIGYYFNEYRQDKPTVVYEEDEWVGCKYLLGGVGIAAWIYNNDNGDIIFKITPSFQKGSNDSYEKWIKDYRCILMRKIPNEIAQEWLDKAIMILKIIEQNTEKNYGYLLQKD